MTLLLVVLMPFLGALVPAIAIRAGRDVCAIATGAVSFTALALLVSHASDVFGGDVVQARLEWLPWLGLNANFFLDGLGFLFAGLILGIGVLIILYARFYLSKNDSMARFYTYLLLFQGAMVGIVLSDNILMLLIFWELTSLSSFLLIGYWGHLPEGRQGARMALTITGMGGLAMIGGMLILGDIAGSYDISTIVENSDAIQASPLYAPALLLILLGCFTKSAQFPFHFWLPHAMAAPTPVSAYLHSATMVKAGLFLMARLWPALSGTDVWFYLVASTGLVTMVVGALVALFKDDLKALLAFSTVSHLGFITMLLGFGTPFAAVVAVFHIINHATFKCALFMTAGIIDHEAHTRDIRRLGGLRTLMPVTFVIATIASLSMAGVPLLNGFLSKEMMLEAAAHTTWLGSDLVVPVLATVGALFSVAYSLRYIWHVFFGPVRDDYPSKPHDPGFGMWVAPAFLAVLVVLIGVAPAAIVGDLVANTARAVIGSEDLPYYSLKIWHGVTPALFMSVAAILGGAALLSVYHTVNRYWLAAPRPEAKAIFESVVARVQGGGRWLADALHDGSMARYSAVFFVAVAIAGGMAHFGGVVGESTREVLPIGVVPLIGWALLIIATGCMIAFHHNRLIALILMGVIGTVVSLGFAYASAPDLALTQISVEVVTVILLLLALNFMPSETPRESGSGRRLRDAAIASVCGLGVGGLVYLMMLSDFTASTISAYHIENSKPGGGGTNVVNVILVDFRGFDTFGEIIVLGIAALVIFAVTETVLRGEVGRRLARWTPPAPGAGDRHPLMMVVATRVMMPLALMVGAFIFLRGHNEPGGGFVAGLVVAIALLMQYMASGFAWAEARQRFPYHRIIAAGILIAALTGLGSIVAGRPFLTSAFGYFQIPPMEEFELATAMAFDLGVFLTVVGAVMLALESLSRIARHAGETVNVDPMDVQPGDVQPGEPTSVQPGAPTSVKEEAV